jgi:hypothetical protein
VVDKAAAAAKIAAIWDAMHRIQSRTPADAEQFVRDRDARDIVTMNLLVAIQESLALAAHWLAGGAAGVCCRAQESDRASVRGAGLASCSRDSS